MHLHVIFIHLHVTPLKILTDCYLNFNHKCTFSLNKLQVLSDVQLTSLEQSVSAQQTHQLFHEAPWATPQPIGTQLVS